MFCPRCGKPVPVGAAFCPACGSPVTPTVMGAPAAAPRAVPRPAVATGGVAADFEAQRRRNRLMMVGVGAAALVAAFFGARAFGLLRLGASSPKPALQVRAEGPGASLQIPGRLGPPSLQVPGSAPAPNFQEGAKREVMPAVVRDWLNHLQECERRKVALATSQIQSLTVGAIPGGPTGGKSVDELTNPDTSLAPGTKTKAADTRPAWTQLGDFFRSKQPPTECMTLASDFNRALSETGGMMSDVSDAFKDIQSDPSSALKKLCGMVGTSKSQIDTYFNKADDELKVICATYDTSPWFSIREDVGNGGMLSMFADAGAACGN